MQKPTLNRPLPPLSPNFPSNLEPIPTLIRSQGVANTPTTLAPSQDVGFFKELTEVVKNIFHSIRDCISFYRRPIAPANPIGPQTAPPPPNPSSLRLPCLNGSIGQIRGLIQRRAPLNTPDHLGKRALHYACEGGSEEVVRALLEGGAEVNTLDNSQKTPLHYAAEYGHSTLIRQLANAGATLNPFSSDMVTPLGIACRGNQPQALQTLIDLGALTQEPPFCNPRSIRIATYYNFVEIIRILLRAGIPMLNTDIPDRSPLMLACIRGHAELALMLIQARVPLNPPPNQSGPLHAAAHTGQLLVVQALTQAGAHVNIRNEQGQTPLAEAIRSGHLEIAQFLQTLGAQN